MTAKRITEHDLKRKEQLLIKEKADKDAEALRVARAKQLEINKRAGYAAEKRAAIDLAEEGYSVQGTQVIIKTTAGRRIVDYLVQDKNGNWIAVEVKSGNAVRSKAQKKKDALIETEGGIVIGENIPPGLYNGQIIYPETIVKRY